MTEGDAMSDQGPMDQVPPDHSPTEQIPAEQIPADQVPTDQVPWPQPTPQPTPQPQQPQYGPAPQWGQPAPQPQYGPAPQWGQPQPQAQYGPAPQWGQQPQAQPQPQYGPAPQWGQQWQQAPQQPGYGWPPPPPPAPQRRIGRKQITSIVALVVIALVGGGVYAYDHFKSTDEGVSAVTCQPSTLTSCLVAKPSSASSYPDSWGSSRTPATADYVKWAFDSDPVAQKTASDNLASEGLQNIAHTAWKAADGDGIDITLLKFSSPQGAHARGLELLGADMTNGGPVSAPDGLPGSAYTNTTPNSDGDIVARYSAYVGDVALQVHYTSPGAYSAADFASWLSAEYKSLTTAPKAAPSPQPTGGTQSVTCSDNLSSCLTDSPSGSTAWSDSWGGTTSPTAKQYVTQMFSGSSWQNIISARLKAAGLTGISHHAWVTSNGEEADDLLLSFGTANGATAWYKNDVYSATGTSFTVPGQQNATGTYDPKADADGNISAQVFGVNGTVVMELFTWSPKSFDQTRTVTWASQQLGKIGSTSKTQPAPAAPVPTPTASKLVGGSDASISCDSAQDCLMAAPNGAVPWSGADYDKSTTATVDEYVKENWSSESSAQQAYEANLLNDAGVKAIAHREWDAADGSSTIVTILQYGSDEQAQSEALDYQGAILATGSEITVPGLDDAVVDIKPLDTGGDVPVKIDLWKGNYEVRLAYYSLATADPQAAVSVALQQLAKMAGGG